MKPYILYLVIINLVGFIVMFIDKQKAIHNKWRIPEKTLFIVAIVGGSLGAILGMEMFRHKTKHLKFKYGFPIILTIQMMLTYTLLINK